MVNLDRNFSVGPRKVQSFKGQYPKLQSYEEHYFQARDGYSFIRLFFKLNTAVFPRGLVPQNHIAIVIEDGLATKPQGHQSFKEGYYSRLQLQVALVFQGRLLSQNPSVLKDQFLKPNTASLQRIVFKLNLAIVIQEGLGSQAQQPIIIQEGLRFQTQSEVIEGGLVFQTQFSYSH